MIDVIIPTKNSSLTLRDCLAALKKQPCIGNIIIVDGESTDGTLEIAEEFGCKIYHEPKTKNNRKSAEARNEGLLHSESIFVAFVDADAIVPDMWLENLIKYFRNPSVAGVTSGSVWKGGNKQSLAINKVIQFGSTHARRFKEVENVQSIPTYNALYSRGVFSLIDNNIRERPQIFDETLGGCEDWELNYRIRKAGFKLLGVPESPVEHRERPTWKSFWRQMFHYAWARGRVTKLKKIFSLLYAFPSLGLLFLLTSTIASPSLSIVLILSYLASTCIFSLTMGDSKLAKHVFVAFNILVFSWALGFIWGLLN